MLTDDMDGLSHIMPWRNFLSMTVLAGDDWAGGAGRAAGAEDGEPARLHRGNAGGRHSPQQAAQSAEECPAAACEGQTPPLFHAFMREISCQESWPIYLVWTLRPQMTFLCATPTMLQGCLKTVLVMHPSR